MSFLLHTHPWGRSNYLKKSYEGSVRIFWNILFSLATDPNEDRLNEKFSDLKKLMSGSKETKLDPYLFLRKFMPVFCVVVTGGTHF